MVWISGGGCLGHLTGVVRRQAHHHAWWVARIITQGRGYKHLTLAFRDLWFWSRWFLLGNRVWNRHRGFRHLELRLQRLRLSVWQVHLGTRALHHLHR
ncbi:hypothetical protein FKM82_027837 [Ascaphus truei]